MIDQCRRMPHLALHVKVQRENRPDRVQYQALSNNQDHKQKTQASAQTTSHQVDKILLENQLRSFQVSTLIPIFRNSQIFFI